MTPMQEASAESVPDAASTLRLLHRNVILAGAWGRRALATSGART